MEYTARVKAALLAVLASIPLWSHGEIFRCTAAGGGITYQEIPCGAADQSRVMGIPATFPEVNTSERNRLLQREAAADARLLERMRIESAERVAQSELAARERVARAEREAAELAAQQYGYPVFVTGPAYRPRPTPHHPLLRPVLPRL